jgi:uncharacterized protein YecE (DUF72 family)
LAQRRELEYASRQFNSIEINGSFYSLQRPSSWKSWYEETPEGFLFSVKGGRYLTHMLKLTKIEEPLANFFAQGVLGLEEKLGPILWQFPPQFGFDAGKFERFFRALPRDTEAAAEVAKGHGKLMKGRTFFKVKKKRKLRHAVEIRHESFATAEFVGMLREHDVGLVVADTAGKWPFLEDVTSDFVYARLHGDEQLYVSGYSPAALDSWAKRVKAWMAGGEAEGAKKASEKGMKKAKSREVFVYFDNDVKVRAPFDAFGLSQRTGGFMPEHPVLEPPANLPHEAREGWPVVRRD